MLSINTYWVAISSQPKLVLIIFKLCHCVLFGIDCFWQASSEVISLVNKIGTSFAFSWFSNEWEKFSKEEINLRKTLVLCARNCFSVELSEARDWILKFNFIRCAVQFIYIVERKLEIDARTGFSAKSSSQLHLFFTCAALNQRTS